MTTEIGRIIKDKLATLAFIDRLAGVIKVITMTNEDANGNPITKTFPVSCDVNFTDCDSPGHYMQLMPDDSVGCIVYLEDSSLEQVGVNAGRTKFKTQYRIVGWVNAAKLGYSDCSITGTIIANIIKALTQPRPENHGIYQGLYISFVRQEAKTGTNPFLRFTYDEDKTQYLMYPFDYFSLVIEVSFEVNNACILPLEVKDPINCL